MRKLTQSFKYCKRESHCIDVKKYSNKRPKHIPATSTGVFVALLVFMADVVSFVARIPGILATL